MKFNSAIFFIILVLASCEFEPSGEYTPDIKIPHSVAPLEVDLNVQGDTIFIIVEGSVDFKFQTFERKLHWVRFCIGINCEIYDSNTGSFGIRLDDNVWPGTHELTIEVYTGTGSGSIADVLGVEGFLYSKSWTLIVEKFITFDEGKLKLTWNRYIDPDFKEYVIFKTPEGASGYTLAVINDPYSTVVYDDSYFGGKAEYIVEVNTTNNKVDWISDSFEDDVPRLYTEVNNTSMKLTWDSSKYINNITGFKIYEFEPMFKTYELIDEIAGNNITSYDLDSLMFLKGYTFALLPVSKRMPVYQWGLDDKIRYLGATTSNYIGNKYDWGKIKTTMGDFLYYETTDYANSCKYIFKYNYIKEEVADKIKLSMQNMEYAISPNGKFVLIIEGFNDVHIYNTENSEIRTYPLEEFSDQYESVSTPAISNNGIGVIQFYLAEDLDGVPSNSTFIYDFINDKKIHQCTIIPAYKISADGKYLLENWRTMYQILPDSLLQIPVITDELIGINYFEFHMDDPELIVYCKNYHLYIKRISDLSTISEFHLPGEQLLNIDYNAKKFLTSSYGKLHLHDLNSSEELWSYPAATQLSRFGARLCNNIIYDSDSGRKLIIE
jgi:hypothetical protein